MYHYFSKITLIRSNFPLKALKSIVFKKKRFRHRLEAPPPPPPPPAKKNPKNVQNTSKIFF